MADMPAKIYAGDAHDGNRWTHRAASHVMDMIGTTYYRADLVEQMAADLDEGFQILGNLIDSIQRHGNYSPESTITFVDQARQCVRVAILRARQAADTEGAK